MHIISVGGCGERVSVCVCSQITVYCVKLVGGSFAALSEEKSFALIPTEQSGDLLHLWFSATVATVSESIRTLVKIHLVSSSSVVTWRRRQRFSKGSISIFCRHLRVEDLQIHVKPTTILIHCWILPNI